MTPFLRGTRYVLMGEEEEENPHPGEDLLMETGDWLLLETGDSILLEA